MSVARPTWERFWRFVGDPTPGGCWEWTGSLRNGYGVVWNKPDSKAVYAHRLMYSWAVGPIPEGLYVCHTCDNRRCVNPAHLWVGTQAENLEDMTRKGRRAHNTGPRPSPPIPCAWCGTPFRRKARRLRCCSHSCGQRLRQARERGEVVA